MTLTRRTVVMLAVTAVLVVVNLWSGGAPVVEPELASVPGVLPESVAVLQISTPIDKLRMERTSTDKTSPDFEKWRIVTPLDFPADAAQIRSILRIFGPGIPMEAYVDAGNHEDYGVDDQHGELVELFRAGEDIPAAAVVVGKTAAGPSTFVRLPGGPEVYRADVGGQPRYARPAAEWRDKMATELDRAAVTQLVLRRGTETLRFTRGPSIGTDAKGNPQPGPWQLDGAGFVVDTDLVDTTIRTLARIRAGEIHNPDYVAGFDAPRGAAELALGDGRTVTITLGGRETDGASFIQVSGRDEVFRVSGAVGRAILQPKASFRDRRLLSFERGDVASIAYVDRGLTVVLSQSDDGVTWAVTQPANMDADQKEALFTVNTLATLRAAGIPDDTRFDASGARFEVRFRDGRTTSLDLGQKERDAGNRPVVRARVRGNPGVFLLLETTVTELRRAFGRG